MDFCWTGLREAGGCVKSMCACLCCLICGGPILFIIGIVFLVSKNTREQDIKSYNEAVAAYDPSPVDSWVPGTIQGNFVSLTSEPNPIEGNRDGIDEVGVSRMVSTSMVARSSYSFVLSNVSAFTATGINPTKSKTSTARCERNNGCTRSQMEDYCEDTYSSSATYIGGSCSSGTCGECRYDTYLSEVCAVVSSTFPFTRDSRYTSCYYPFGASDQIYSSSPVVVSVYARKADDPFIALQRITQGTNDFGLTEAQQRKLGLVLIIIGAILIGCVVIIACLIVHLIRAALSRKDQVQPQQQQIQVYPAPTTATVIGVYPSGGQQIPPVNPGYAPPPPGYTSPPQPGYGYGAPPQPAPQSTGYGAPAYGQNGYAQPQQQPGYAQPQQQPSYAQQGFTNTPQPVGYPVQQPPQKSPDFGY